MKKINKLYAGIFLAIVSIVSQSVQATPNSINSTNTGTGGAKYILRISHIDRANSIKGKFFIRFKELLEEKHPNVTVQLNEYGKLAKRKQEIDLLELGVVDMIAPDVEDLYEKTKDEKLKIVNLPYLFEDNNSYYKFIKSPVRLNFINSITNPNKSYIPLTVIGEGFELFAAKTPIKKELDLEDKNLITGSVLTNQTFYNQLKLKSFTYSDFEDLDYISNVSKGNLFELSKQKYTIQDAGEYFPNIYLSNHKYSTSIVLVNKSWFNKLPDNIKKSIQDLFTENAKYNEDLIIKSEDLFNDRVVKIYGKNIVNISKEDKDELKKLSKPMHEYYLERVNKGLLLNMYKEIQK